MMKEKRKALILPHLNAQPNEILIRIFVLLSARDLVSLMLVSSKLKDVVTDDLLWKILYFKDFSPTSATSTLEYKSLYKTQFLIKQAQSESALIEQQKRIGHIPSNFHVKETNPGRNILTHFVIIGEKDARKYALIDKYISNSIFGVEFRTKKLSFDNNNILKLFVWDTTGQDRYGCVTSPYIRNKSCIIIAGNMEKKNGLTDMSKWLETAVDYKDPNTLIAVIGNYEDRNNLQITEAELQKFLQEFFAQPELQEFFNSNKNLMSFHLNISNKAEIDAAFKNITDKIVADNQLFTTPKNPEEKSIGMKADDASNRKCTIS